MDHITKKTHLYHSLLSDFRKDISQEIAKSISKNFDVPIDEAVNKCSALVTGFMIHALYSSMIEKPQDGKKLAAMFLTNIGKSENDIQEINNLYGTNKAETKQKFKILLEDYLGVPIKHTLSDFYYLRVDTACESIEEIVEKKSDSITLKDGVLELVDTPRDKNFTEEFERIKNDLTNREKSCPFCKTKGFFFKEFTFKGKDKVGFIYFQCPECHKDIQYDTLTGTVKTQKGLLGFLFGKFS